MDDDRRAWILRVLGIDVAQFASGPSREELAGMLKDIAADAQVAGVRDEIAPALREAAQAVQKNAPGAAVLVESLSERLAELVRGRRMAEVRKLADGVVAKAGERLATNAVRRLKLLALNTRYAQAVGNLEAACDALIGTRNFATDPRILDDGTQDAVAEVGDRVPDVEPLIASVERALDDIAAADDPRLHAPIIAGALQAIEAYRAKIDADPLLTYMENTEAGSYTIHSGLNTGLDELAEALRG